ncbi:MAG: hypothetical protein HY903_09315 [Deltaproteobacteria bacterium]|nr:hypothetical protein [Deltaproteobacteria bacterium]
MELLRGQPAVAAARALFASPGIPAVDVDPQARGGGALTVLALATPERAVLVDRLATPDLGALFAAAAHPFAAEHAKTVHRALLRAGLFAPARWACTHLTAQLLAAGRDHDLSLAGLCARAHLPAPPEAAAGMDAWAARLRATAAVVGAVKSQLKEDGLVWVSRLEAAAVAPIALMEHAGMPFDGDAWRAVTFAAERERRELETKILQALRKAGDTDLFGAATLHLDNDAELKAALTAVGYPLADVRRETVAALPAPLGPWLARSRELLKITSAYGESFLAHVGADGRIHPTFEQIGATTGRLSCHSPNLQAMVKGTPHRACFKAAPDRRLVVADYSACELRILAEMSGDPVFAEAFAHGEDLHARVATAVFGKPVSKSQNPELRERAKAVNFGLAYGMGAGGLARATGTSLAVARELLERYFRTFPRIRSFLEQSAAGGLERGFAVTMTGRRLMLDPGTTADSRAQAERIAKNMPIQGTSADITKIALARLYRRLPAFAGAALVNTVHDEIVVECAAPDADGVRLVLAEEMQAAGAEVLKHVPVGVDSAVCQHWDK